MNPNILVTGIGGPAGRALAAQLAAQGIAFLGADMNPLPPDAKYRSVVVPPATDPSMMHTVKQLISEHHIDLVIPTVSEELPQFAAVAAALGKDVDILIAGAGPVAAAHDKLFTAWHLQAAGVAIPAFGVPEDFEDARSALHAFGGAIVVKPRVSRGGRGVIVIEHPDDVVWSNIPSGQIIQQFVPGLEYAPAVYRPADRDESRCFVTVLEKIELAQGRVGNAVSVERLDEGEARDVGALALATASALDLIGPVDIDIRRMADGTPVVLEVNARFGANSEHAPELLGRVLDAHAAHASRPVRMLV